MAGLAFFEPATVLPVLLARLGASDALIGLSRFIQMLGFTLPTLFASHYIHGRVYHKGFLVTVCAIGRVPLLLFPVVLLLYGETRPQLAVTCFLVVFALFWLMDGCCAVSWFDIVAKAIPARVRGRFFGAIQTIGGLMAIGAGAVVALVLRPGGLEFPHNFALLAMLWFLGVAVSQVGLFLIREPPGVVEEEEEKPPFMAFLRQALPMLRRNPGLARVILTRLLLDGSMLAAPFYVLFAQRDLGVSLRMVGIYAVIQSVGRVCTGPLWGWIADRYGSMAGLRAVAGAMALTPLLALAAANGQTWAFPAVFFLMGAVQDGLWMMVSNAYLGAVSARERPLAIGVTSLLQTPSSLYGPLGGLLAEHTSYTTVFVAALVLTSGGLLTALRTPRQTR